MSFIPPETVLGLAQKSIELSLDKDAANLVLQKSYRQDLFAYKQVTKDFSLKLFQSQLMENGDQEKAKERFSSLLFNAMDVIPDEYEGGFKVWEGLFDLVDFIHKSDTISEMIQTCLDNGSGTIRICDLGCGSGLLSLYIGQQLKTKLKGGQIEFEIFLQDYNESVLKYFTIPNIAVNDGSLMKCCRFLYGDWQLVRERLHDHNDGIKFNLIVTAETIYKEENYRKLCDLFAACTEHHWAQILVACKSHYFGIGGGTYSFIDYVNEKYPKLNEDCQLVATVVEEIDQPLIRNVIQLKPKFQS